MATPHINAEKGDFADTVLMPGDPLRAKYIADTYLENVRQVNDVRSMFGVRATRLQKRIEVIVKLVEWNDSLGFDRIGLEEDWVSILDVEVPQVTVPIYPGKHITVIAEAIAMNYQLKLQGYHTANEFNRRLVERMKQKKRSEVVLRADVE